MVLSGGGYLGIDNKHLRVEEHPDGVIRGWGGAIWKWAQDKDELEECLQYRK